MSRTDKTIKNDIHSTLWSIDPKVFNKIVDALGDQSLDALMVGDADQDAPSNITIRDGVGILDITGPIMRYGGGFFSFLFRSASIDGLARDFQALIDDDQVRSIILNIDSPGGTVAGVHEFANMIYNARAEKPISAYIGGQGASAAYWIASAADEIVVDETALAGSIGVVMTVFKGFDDEVEIVSTQSPNKRPDPETDAGRAELQRTVDAIAQVFVENVARNRDETVETVLNQFGQGGLVVGEAAIDHGLADRLGNLEDLIQTNAKGFITMAKLKLSIEDLKGYLEAIQSQAPELLKALTDPAFAEGRAQGIEVGTDTGRTEGVAEATTAERERVMALLGSDADPLAILGAIADGISVDASFKIFFEAEVAKRGAGLEAMQNQATAPIGGEPPVDPNLDPADKQLAAKAVEIAKRDGVGISAAMAQARKENPTLAVTWRPADGPAA